MTGKLRLAARIVAWHRAQRRRRADLPSLARPLALLFPPHNLLCAAIVKILSAWGTPTAARLAARSLESGHLYGALRHISPVTRAAFAELAAARFAPPPEAPDPESAARAAALHAQGYARLGTLLGAADTAEARAYFAGQDGYFAQVQAQSDGAAAPFARFAEGGGNGRYFCFAPEVSLGCAPLRRLLASPVLRDTVRAYVGANARLYSVNTFATRPGEDTHYVMRWHRDYDDFRCLAVFVYWTDVGAENGATLVRTGADDSPPVALAGSAGEAFAMEPFAMHAGNEQIRTVRLATWLRFGYPPNLASVQDGYWSEDWARRHAVAGVSD